jgi:nitric oxide dioxygenase
MIDPSTTFSKDETDLLVRSFARVSADPKTAAAVFYGQLFELAPETRSLFLSDMDRQGGKLIATLSSVIVQIGNLSGLRPTIEELGLRHVAYGVLPEHYPATGEALYRMLAEILGEDFSSETRAAWEKAYAAISHIMATAVENRKSAKSFATDPAEDDD